MAALPFSRFIFLGIVASALTVGCRVDDDEDGYSPGEGDLLDCDDDDADIHPGADEYCDGVDNNCDGVIDEADALDVAVWYGDGDGDGFGLDSATEYSCTQPNGYVEQPGDCDDTNAALNPDTNWYADADGDTFGDPDSTQQVCIAPAGYVADDTDCDDTRDDVNPDEDEACDETDHDCTGHDGMYDEDGDGVAECEGDCDDDDSDDPDQGPFADEIFPGADEYCDEMDNDCDDEIDEDDAVDAPTWYLDYDGDGYGGDGSDYTLVQCDDPGDAWVDNTDDCDDLETTTYPGADEYCNDIDDDCDDEVDETGAVDAPTYYEDGDGDGYGTDASTVTDECDAPSGYGPEADDCDDEDADTYPGADEYCDGHDDNCDGVVDETTAVDTLTWYEDLDGDGYGNSAVVASACSEPSGYTAASGDCNEYDSTINPDADEYCDGTDNDCDGVTDEDDAADADTWYADADGDDYGDAGSSQNACSQPTDYVEDASDCDDSDGSISPGADEICNDGIDNNCSGGFDACTMDMENSDTVYVGGADGDQAGRFIATVGDLNIDGIDDIMIGARSAAGTAGANYIFYGPITAAGQITLGDGSEAGIVEGSTAGYYAAVSAAGGQDMDGDGAADFAIGTAAPNTEQGVAWVFFAEPSGTITTDDADVTISGDNNYDRTAAPNGLAFLGDIDGDGGNDLAVAAYSDDYGGSNAGSVYVVYGPLTSGTDAALGDYEDLVYGESASSSFGAFTTQVGDVDGDGLPELAVGTSIPNSYAGRAYIFHEAPSGAISAADADVILDGEDASDYFGTSLAGGGDIDDDGYDDYVVGSTHDDLGTTDAGAVYLVSGTATSDVVSAVMSAKLYGLQSSGKFGGSVDAVHDYYGDYSYEPAIVVGASNEGASAHGALYLFLGSQTGTVSSANADGTFTGTSSGDAAGATVQFSGDIDGSNAPAIFTSTYYADQGGTDAGAAYVIFDIDE